MLPLEAIRVAANKRILDISTFRKKIDKANSESFVRHLNPNRQNNVDDLFSGNGKIFHYKVGGWEEDEWLDWSKGPAQKNIAENPHANIRVSAYYPRLRPQKSQSSQLILRHGLYPLHSGKRSLPLRHTHIRHHCIHW